MPRWRYAQHPPAPQTSHGSLSLSPAKKQIKKHAYTSTILLPRKISKTIFNSINMAPFLKKIPLKDIPSSVATGGRVMVHRRDHYFRSEMDGKPIILQVQIKAKAIMVSSNQKSSEPQGNEVPSITSKATMGETLPPLLKSSEDMDPLPPLPFMSKDDSLDNIRNLFDDMDQDTFLGNTEEDVASLLQEPFHNESQQGFSYGLDKNANIEAQLLTRLHHQQPQSEPIHPMYEPTNVDDLAELNEFSQLLLDDPTASFPEAGNAENMESHSQEYPEIPLTVDRGVDHLVQPLQAAQLTLGSNDVVMGRGGLANNHSGNKKFHRKKEELQPKYLASSRHEKRKVAKELVEWVWGNGGRFLQKTELTGDWEEAPFDKVILKGSQALRTVKMTEPNYV